MSKRKFAPDANDRNPSVTITITKSGMRRHDHRKRAEVLNGVSVGSGPAMRNPVPSDIREMLASEKALQESYNSLDQHLRVHRPCQDEALAPNYGGMLYRMWQQKKLTKQQLDGWQSFWEDLMKAAGSSNSVVASLEGGSTVDYATRELQKARPGPAAHWNLHAVRVTEAWNSLRKHERGLLAQVIRDTLRTEGNKDIHAHSVDYLGGILSGYHDNRQKIAAGVSAIQRLLISIAEFYGFQPFDDDTKGESQRVADARLEKTLNLREKRLVKEKNA